MKHHRRRKGRKAAIPKPQHEPALAELARGLTQAEADAILRAVMVPKPIDPTEAAAVVMLLASRAARTKPR